MPELVVSTRIHSNLNASISSADGDTQALQNFNGKWEVEVRAVVKNLHGTEFWGKFFVNGRKGKEASWAGIRGRFTLPRFQLFDHDPSSGGAELWRV